jgi:hypothetical protein
MFGWPYYAVCIRDALGVRDDGVCQVQAGNTALKYAAQLGHMDCVRILLEGGADKEVKNVVRTMQTFMHLCFRTMHYLMYSYACLREI